MTITIFIRIIVIIIIHSSWSFPRRPTLCYNYRTQESRSTRLDNPLRNPDLNLYIALDVYLSGSSIRMSSWTPPRALWTITITIITIITIAIITITITNTLRSGEKCLSERPLWTLQRPGQPNERTGVVINIMIILVMLIMMIMMIIIMIIDKVKNIYRRDQKFWARRPLTRLTLSQSSLCSWIS